MKRSADIYIDLGTANTLIYAKGRGFLLNQPSIVAIRQTSEARSVFGSGQSAKLMLGKTPTPVSIHRPLREGVIADFDNTVRMLSLFLNQIKDNTVWMRPRMIVSLPCRVSNFERKAVEEAAKNLGAGTVHLLDEPMAAAIGARLPVLKNRGSMVIDIGGGTTEIAVISLGGIVSCSAVRIGGDAIDTGIIQHLRQNHYFVVGEQTAEHIKKSVAHLSPKAQLSVTAGGIDLVQNLPAKKTITSAMIHPVVKSVVGDIVLAVHKTIESLPPEIAVDIAENGIVLTGGGALIGGVKETLQHNLCVPVIIPENPLMSVALGGAEALENDKLFDAIAMHEHVS